MSGANDESGSRSWLELFYDRVAEPLQHTVLETATLTASSRFPVGTNVYDRDWDLLVVLDACRVDALRAVADEYEFLSDVESMVSVGSATREWVANTFTTDHLEDVRDTAWVSANGTSQWVLERQSPRLISTKSSAEKYLCDWDVVNADEFLLIDQVWTYATTDLYSGLTPPEFVTDRAIHVGRELDPDRLMVMYKQPHAPYVANALRDNREMEPCEAEPWTSLRSGTPKERIWEAYLDELRYGLDNVETLLNNVDADLVAVTADHGEEWVSGGSTRTQSASHTRK